MAENTKISWATHTFNPWLGCQHATIPGTDEPHPGCLNCYAQAMRGKFGVQWGPESEGGTRRRTADSTWLQVEKWNRKAMCACRSYHGMFGEHVQMCPQFDRPRIFPSACDPFEEWDGEIFDSHGEVLTYPTPECKERLTLNDVRRDFFALIDRTPNLNWLLLTKRPQNVRRTWIPYLKASALGREIAFRHNVWLLYSASDQRSLDAGLPYLLECRDLVSVLGLSLEPLVGPINLSRKLFGWDPITGRHDAAGYCDRPQTPDWIICGGESGPHARPCEVQWIRDIRDKCEAAGVPLFVKQWFGRYPGQQGRIPDDLWSVKEFPR